MPETLRAFFYVSDCCLGPDVAEIAVAKLVAQAQEKNARLCITGALVFTGERFAQHIEGPPREIEGLVSLLRQDTRHRNMVTMRDEPASSRLFDAWSMAYSGPALYIRRHLDTLFESHGFARKLQIERFSRLLIGLTESGMRNGVSINRELPPFEE